MVFVYAKKNHYYIQSNPFLCDFNIHVDKTTDSHTLKFNQVLYNLGPHQLVDKPTHVSNHILDLIIRLNDGDCHKMFTCTKNVVFSKIIFWDHLAVFMQASKPQYVIDSHVQPDWAVAAA